MKRIAALAAVMAVLAMMCGCGDKPVDDDIVEDVTASVSESEGTVTGDTSSAEEFVPTVPELKEADFVPINIKTNIVEKEPPIKIEAVDLTGLDLGKRLSPCKAEDVCDNYSHRSVVDDPVYDKAYNELLSEPCEGFVENYIFIGGKYYLCVNYDDHCGCHDSSLFSYDADTCELKELVKHTGLEYGGCFDGIMELNGEPVYYDSSDSSGEKKSSIYIFDTKSGTEKKLCELNGSVIEMKGTEKGIVAALYHGERAPRSCVEYDLSTGEVSELLDDPFVSGADNENAYFCEGIPAEVICADDMSSMTVKTQYYSIQSDHANFTDILMWRDKMVVFAFDNYASRMYTYDIDRRECLKMNADALRYSTVRQAGDGIILTAFSPDEISKENLYYLDPTLGTAYCFDDCAMLIEGNVGDTVYVMTFRRRAFDVSKPFVSYHAICQYEMDKLYRIVKD